jgi:hypothetical protein
MLPLSHEGQTVARLSTIKIRNFSAVGDSIQEALMNNE